MFPQGKFSIAKRSTRLRKQLFIVECQPNRLEPYAMVRKPEFKFWPCWDKQSKKRTKIPTKVSQSLISVPGVEKVCSSNKRWKKILWFCATAVLYSLCIYQLIERLNAYFEHPVALDVKLEKVKSIEFPSITLCPYPEFGVVKKLMHDCKRRLRTFGELDNCSIAEHLNTSLAGVWHSYSVQSNYIKWRASCAKRSEKDDCSHTIPTEKNHFFSSFGTCTSLSLTNELQYRGAQTYFEIELSPNKSKKVFAVDEDKDDIVYDIPMSEILFTAHDINVNAEHMVYFLNHRLKAGLRADIRFHLKKIRFLDTKENPCVSSVVAEKCEHDCVANHLVKHVECRLPFMSESLLPVCQTLASVSQTMANIHEAYESHDGCDCPRQCHENLIEFSIDNYTSENKTAFIFSLRFPDNVVEVITEYYTYNLSSLLSDIGGSLGFFVGLSLFSFIELVDCFAQRLVSTFFK